MTILLPPPLGGVAPEEKPLANAPLARVVVQARFSSVLKIDSKDGVAPFQELARKDFPLFDQISTTSMQVDLTPAGPTFRPVPTNFWRFSDPARASIVSLTTDAITFETSAYPGRSAFIEQWATVLRWIDDIYAPGLAVRVGMRYLNRIAGDAIAQLPEWITSNLIGVALPDLRGHVSQAISEANLDIEEGGMLLRWGIIPKDGTIDPGLLEPLESASWLLDIDAFSNDQRSFDAEELVDVYRRLSERIYAVFRWTLTPAGLQHFEGRS
jgi:uncharacterized protein (TIGR04255 family)